MNDWIKISAPLTKIGNSFSVRIPMNVVNQMKAEEGNLIVMKVRRLSLAMTPEVTDLWFKTARSCKDLNKFSDDKIFLFSRLAHNEGKHLMESVNEKYDIDKKDKEAGKKMLNAMNEYRDKIKEDFGKKVLDDFLFFREIIQPKMDEQNRT
ncbi:MAG: hypothetical protein MAG795_00898 [Candidatus Woesearchaeota archaeon]|nr:hypothetical protein [Candidatus Woesearchaeota archaeon]